MSTQVSTKSPGFKITRTRIQTRLLNMTRVLADSTTQEAELLLGHGFKLMIENVRIPAFRGMPSRIKPEASLYVDGIKRCIARDSSGVPYSMVDASHQITRYLLEHGFNPEVLG